MKKTRMTMAALCLFGLANAQQKEFKPYTTTLSGTTIQFNMVPIPSGSFIMGSPLSEKGRNADEGPQKKIEIPAFWMGTHEVTHDEFLVFFDDESIQRNSPVDVVTRPTPQYIDFSLGMGKQGGFPANSMSQYAALMYCRWLYQTTGIFYRLPTESEWEYACRAGTSSAYPFGNDSNQLKEYAWYDSNSGNKYHKTGEKKPNAWGLYDMLGNVSEWTMNQYLEDYFTRLQDGATNPLTDPTSKYPKTLKGGGYNSPAAVLRSASRVKSDPVWNRRDPQIPKSKWWLTEGGPIGFRVVAPLEQPTAEEANIFYAKYLK